jgi:hypothetical protein
MRHLFQSPRCAQASWGPNQPCACLQTPREIDVEAGSDERIKDENKQEADATKDVLLIDNSRIHSHAVLPQARSPTGVPKAI